ncbi:uncharacterized protein LOC144317304 [Canis aureus]
MNGEGCKCVSAATLLHSARSQTTVLFASGLPWHLRHCRLRHQTVFMSHDRPLEPVTQHRGCRGPRLALGEPLSPGALPKLLLGEPGRVPGEADETPRSPESSCGHASILHTRATAVGSVVAFRNPMHPLYCCSLDVLSQIMKDFHLEHQHLHLLAEGLQTEPTCLQIVVQTSREANTSATDTIYLRRKGSEVFAVKA